VNRYRRLSKSLGLVVAIALTVSALMPLAAERVYASSQNVTPLVVSVPSMWEDVLTSDLLAEFEAQHPGVDVIPTFDDTALFGFAAPGSTVDTQLDATEELVDSADVLYVSPTSLSAADTQAGYFLDLSPLVMSDPALDVADFIPAVWQSFQWDNGIWALPLSVDVIVLTYDPAAFDEAGLAYPNERWTIDDFANAARKLAQYNADGTVETPGFSTVSGGNNQSVFLRALAGAGFYDLATLPNAPSFSDPDLEYTLQVWDELIQDGVVLAQGGGRDENIPLRVEGINGYSQRGPNQSNNGTRNASLLPGGVAGLSVQGFAVSAGTQYPELAYALASFLTALPELANNSFSAAPARYSLAGTESANNTNNDGPGNGPGGGPGGGFFGSSTIPETIQPVVDQGLASALPVSELRYATYLDTALSDMNTNGTDAQLALQTAEAQAISDTQTAVARAGTVTLFVTPPEAAPALAPGKIELICAVNQGFGGGPGGRSQLPNQDEWDQVIADFVATDPLVGAVTLVPTQESDLATLAGQYDCFILPSNAVEGSDVSGLLNLDPLLDADPTFDRDDVIGNTLAQLQQDNKTWALPLAIEPQMLEYDQEQFARAGVPEPTSGWTVDAFIDALRRLKPYDTDPTPFAANDPSGSYIMMLIAAFGGLPLDYRTDPPAVNFTDQATVDAIRQVLDLVKGGYISYGGLADFGAGNQDNSAPAITTNTFNQFRGPGPGGPNAEQQTLITTTFPQGTQYNAIAYEITTGYISATTQNPDATYRFLSEVSRNPQLFSGMPVRQSLTSDPAVVAAQGEEIVSIYQQIDALLRSPNTIIFPTFTAGRGGGPLTMMQSYWLRRAFDRYVSEGADLETELADAETLALAYQECVQSITVDTSGNTQDQGRQTFELISQCATTVDPTFSMGS
jgi:ABC-type glycerol-3-phosphate transport system substrate-binding protein